ncbi:MAG: aldo/keto reductase [Deferribacteres bacterium]|nr:aldo/keto reductase [Deferribacteres bacterium]
MKNQPGINRRDFLRTALAGSTVGILPLPLSASQQSPTQEQSPIKMEFRTLGKTGLKVSAIGMGTMRTTDPNVIHYAIDNGVNYFDTAHCYMNGNNEPIVGTVLKTRRKEVVIATKLHIADEKTMVESVESSLKNLQTDVIDVIQLHSLKEGEQPKNDEAMNALDKLRKRGLVRFVGFTTHKNQVEVIEAGLETGFYDTVLVTYSYKSEKEIGEVINKAAKAGMGIIAMKTQQGGYESEEFKNLSPHQAALRWVLQNPNVHTTIPSMVAFAHVDENVGTMRSKFGAIDQKTLQLYGDIFAKDICNFCGSCDSQCSHHVPVQDVNRCLMYAEGYRDYNLAFETYRDINKEHAVNACIDCETCTVTCTSGLDIPSRLKKARDLFNPILV